jgi:1-deoxy-D-xylulose-5-phosphate reductoisomerase
VSDKVKVAVLGSTGSIGRQALDVLEAHTDEFEIVALAAGRDEAAFAEHSNAPHFKTLILEQAVPRLAKRERSQHRFVA